MQYTYRNVWNASIGAWTNIIETTHSVSNNNERMTQVVATAVLLLCPVVSINAQEPSAVVSSGNTSVYLAPNGATVVDIATPNGAGLSHNYYTRYNVDPTGLVLNNGNTDVVARQSQLAGQITANFNLTKPAGVILNEVVSNNRSTLAGFTEVLGNKADVVLANPYGISCTGCGFINTDRVTLSTGTPYFNGAGTLGGFSVDRGDILNSGSGFNATGQQILDLVTRSARLDAPINAQDLTITTGANSWDYSTRSVTERITPYGSTPAYAIDSAALGGMYANNIRLTATEAGVGVRMLGDAAASASDFTLTAAGRVELNNKISTHRDVMLTSTSNDTDAISLTDTAAVAGRNITVTADQGGLGINASTLIAGTDLKAAGARIKTGQGSKLQAGGTFSANATAGDFELGTASVRATGDLTLRAAGLMSIGGGEGQGVQSTDGKLLVTAGAGLNNAGSISADNGTTTLRVNGMIHTSGLINAGLTQDIADANGGGTQVLNNRGTLLAGQSMNILSSDITNEKDALVQANTGSYIAAVNLNNAGTWLLSQQVNAADLLTFGGKVSNSGMLQSGGSVSLAAPQIVNQGVINVASNMWASTSSFSNVADSTLQVGQALDVDSNGAISNMGVLRGGMLALTARGGLNNVGTITADSGGTSLRVNGLLDNSGQIHSSQTLDITDAIGGSSEAINNTGSLLSDQAINLQGTTVSNSGKTSRIQASTGSTVRADSLSNAGTWLLSQQATARDYVNVGTILNNSGILQSAGSAIYDAAQINNTSTMLAGGQLTANVANGLENNVGAVLQAGQQLSITGNDASLTNGKGAQMLGDGLNLSVARLDNAGAIQGGARKDTAINVKSTLNNQAGGLLNLATIGSGAGMLTAATLTNLGTTQSAGAMTINIGAGGLKNIGSMITGGDLTLQSTVAEGDYNALIGGSLQSGGRMTINGGSATTLDIASTGVVLGNQLKGALGTIHLSDGAKLSSADDMTLSLGTLQLDGSRSAVLGSTGGTGLTTLTTNSGIINNGALFSGNDLTVNAPWLTNAMTGGIVALRNLSVSANNGDLINLGALYAGKALKAIVNVGALINKATLNAYQGTIDSGGSVTLRAGTLINNSTIQGKGDIVIDADILRNEFAGGDSREWGAEGPKTTVQTGHMSKGYNKGGVDQTEAWYYTDTWSQEQYYAGGAPDLNFRPKIIGDGTVNLRFQTGVNLGGVLSGSTMNLMGKSDTATFLNDDYSLQQRDYTDNYEHYINYIAAGPAKYVDDPHYNSSVRFTPSMLSQIGANIYATTLNADGFALVNSGSPWNAVSNQRTGDAINPVASVGAVSTVATTSSANFVGPLIINGASALNFGALTITLPINPNGYYVIALEPGARYLVETNPLYQVGSTAVGSDYLASRLGYDPNSRGRRLGDASYESYLIKQQLIAQIGKSLLNGMENDSEQIIKLMDQAVSESLALGLAYGEPLTQDQQDNLQHDIVWMVQTEINGQAVLTPVVYLGKQTTNNIIQGAGISAETANLSLTSLTNTGGTISGSKSLAVTSSDDITNTSGTIQGGNVMLKSNSGSIVNQTAVQGSGDDRNYTTTIGKTANIQSTGTLSIDADKNITNIGANVSSGGDANLHAGNNVTFDTLQSTTTATTHELLVENLGFASGHKNTTTTLLEQIKSGLNIGGNLNIKTGNDITFAGTDVRVDGNATLEAGKDINIVARENTSKTHSESKLSGIGVNNSLFGSKETTVDSSSVRNVGSTFNVNGNVELMAKGDVTVKGSSLDVAGNGLIEATNLEVLAGSNYDESRTTTKSINVFDFNNIGSAKADASSQGSASAQNKDGKVSASVNGSAEANAQAKGSLNLVSTTTTQTETTELTHIGSQLKFGGNADITTKKDMTLEGSGIDAGGDTNVNARNVNLIAIEDKKTSNTTVESASIGLFFSSDNKASASASASADATAGNSTPNASANANAKGTARSYNELNIMEYSKESQSTSDTKHQGASIHSSGNLNIKANDTLTVTGSSLVADKDMNLDAKDQQFNVVNDEHKTKNSSDKTTVGLYLDAKANANAEAKGAIGLGVNAKALAGVSASAELGVHGTNAKSNSLESSSAAQVSSIKAGGSINRTAINSISDVGTSIEAGDDFNQSAKTITSQAAKNTTHSTSSSENTDARVGVYASASADASLWNTAAGGAAPTGTSVQAGITGGASHNRSNSVSDSAEAVVSNIKVGGNVTSHSLGTTSLEGTNISAGKDVVLEAQTLEVSAAHNSNTSTSSNVQGGATVFVNMLGASGRAEIKAGGGNSSSNSNEAVVANIQAGKNLTINTNSNTRLEGAKLDAGDTASITTGGKLDFEAAQSSSNTNTNKGDGSLTLGGGSDFKNMKAVGNYDHTDSQSRTATVGSITSGGALNINSGSDSTFTGTTLQSGGLVTVSAGGDLNFMAAHSMENSVSGGFNLSLLGKTGTTTKDNKTTNTQNGFIDIGANFDKKDIEKASVSTINSAGGIQLSSGGNTTLEGTSAKTDGSITIDTGGTVKQLAVTDTETERGFDFSFTGQTTRKNESEPPMTSESRAMGLIDGYGIYKSSKHITTLEGGQGVTINENLKSGQGIVPK